MNKQDLDKLKRLTKFSYTEIMKMNSMDFWKNITVKLGKGIITGRLHNWLEEQRESSDLTQQDIDLLDVFGGRIVK